MRHMHERRPRGKADPLEAAIESLLGAGPRLADDLARDAGYSLAATRLRLDNLLHRQRIHREKVHLGQPRWQYLWHLGPAALSAQLPVPVPVPGRDGAGDAEAELLAPSQATVCSYPAVGRRDPLVAALFGPAQGR